MTPFETPHALDHEEIKQLKSNQDGLTPEMKARLQNEQKRSLFVQEYKNYLDRSQNEISKNMIKNLFGNIFDLAEQEGIAFNIQNVDADKPNNLQNIDNTISSQVQSELTNNGSEIESLGITIGKNINISEVFNRMADYLLQSDFIKSQVANDDQYSLLQGKINQLKEEIQSKNLPIITPDNINDPNVQKVVEDAMRDISMKLNMPISPDHSFSRMIEDIQKFETIADAPIDLSETPKFDPLDSVKSPDGKNELYPHRELSLAVFDQLGITRKTSFFDKYINREKGEKIAIYYGEKGGWAFAPKELKIVKSVNNGSEKYTESVTMRCGFGKDGKPENAKSLSYFKKDKDGKIKEKTWSGSTDSYDNVKEFLSSTIPAIIDADLSEDLETALA